MCVIVRDLIVFGVLTDMMRGRPAVYATFSSYDEVAHHSGLERADTMEALRKLDQQFGRIARARRYAPRPYEIVVLSDHGQTQGATFKQRNGYGLDELVERSLEDGRVAGFAGGDEQSAMVQHAVDEATGRKERKRPKNDVSDRQVVVLGSGNLGLVYLMEEPAPAHARGDRASGIRGSSRRCASTRTSAGCWCARPSTAPSCSGRAARRYLTRAASRARIRWRRSRRPRRGTCSARDGFAHVADIMIGSFYDPMLDEGCAFEELISFHGGLGGPQTRPVHPRSAGASRCPTSRSSAPPRSTAAPMLQGGARSPAAAYIGSSSPTSRARPTASERHETSSLRYTAFACDLTVFGRDVVRSAISRNERCVGRKLEDPQLRGGQHRRRRAGRPGEASSRARAASSQRSSATASGTRRMQPRRRRRARCGRRWRR